MSFIKQALPDTGRREEEEEEGGGREEEKERVKERKVDPEKQRGEESGTRDRVMERRRDRRPRVSERASKPARDFFQGSFCKTHKEKVDFCQDDRKD